MMKRVLIGVVSVVLIVTGLVSLVSIYRESVLIVPGFAPVEFKEDDEVVLNVNKITSWKTQVPYAYHDIDGICKPETREYVSENLGEILMGDSREKSLYKVFNL